MINLFVIIIFITYRFLCGWNTQDSIEIALLFGIFCLLIEIKNKL